MFMSFWIFKTTSTSVLVLVGGFCVGWWQFYTYEPCAYTDPTGVAADVPLVRYNIATAPDDLFSPAVPQCTAIFRM